MARKKRDRLPRREQIFETAVVVPTLVALGWASIHALDSLGTEEVWQLLAWIGITASVELIPVPLWRGTIISMGFPLLMVVAFLYPPAIAGSAAFLAASDPREFRREVGLLQALFNRSSIALAVWAASAVFHWLILDIESASTIALVGAALLAAIVDYVVNFGVISIVASLHYRTSPIRVIRELRIGRLSEFVISYLGLAVFGLMLAKFFIDSNREWWIVPVFILPLLLARQMFFRSKALEEAHKELQDREHVLRALSNRMAEERQDERMQIAAFLHDDLAQLLFRLSIQVDVARRHLDAGKVDETEELLLEIKETKNRTSDRIRALIRDLHRSPLGRAGLGEAIRGFLAEMARESDVRFHADVDEVDVPAPIALLLYHNAREGVMNALKHAKASNIWVTVEQEGDEVEMVLRDDGVGFDVEAPGPEGHYGMTMMRERATVGGGTFEIQSVPGQGTTITVRFPTSWLQEEEIQGQGEPQAPSLPPAGASRGAVASPPASPTESIPA
ncbi:MAG TPA: sensor histidine kinase [Candidatus Eisenbacteria bacterium]|nr:sensor histidine kinase [Candidatus Eisenbacteria bacterium]